MDFEQDLDTTSDGSPTSVTSWDSSAESYVPLDEESVKVLTKGQKKKLTEEMEELQHQDMSMWSKLRGRRKAICLPKGCKTFLMEVFAGAAFDFFSSIDAASSEHSRGHPAGWDRPLEELSS